MRHDLKPDVRLNAMFELLNARIYLRICQMWLENARRSGQDRPLITVLEGHVLSALDRLWEAQQRAA